MENIQQQVAALQNSVQRQRIAIFVLAGICTAGVFIGATKPTEDASFKTITCEKLVVVDGDGKVRISAGTLASGSALLQLLEKGGKVRIGATTLADGNANLQLNDKDGKPRIEAGTSANGTVVLPIVDLASPKK